MRINDKSICSGCKKFEHDCNIEENCEERCLSNNMDIIDKFNDSGTIKECLDYEE